MARAAGRKEIKMAVSDYTAAKLFCMEETIAKELFSGVTYPYEVLPSIEEFIVRLGSTLPEEIYEKRGENIWVARNAHIYESAYIAGPCIIDEGAELRQCAFIRGKAIVGKGCVVGNSCELKNVVLFNKCEVPHYNYVGDSVLGFHAHMGAGSITSNIKSDRTNVVIHDGNEMLAESGDNDRRAYKCLSPVYGPRLCPGMAYLQGPRSCGRENDRFRHH